MELEAVFLSTDVFERLQSHATPLKDDVNSLLTKILNVYESSLLAAPIPKPEAVQEVAKPAAPEVEYWRSARGEKLPIGIPLIATYKGARLRAKVTLDGIEYDGVAYDSPSKAAIAAKIGCGSSEEAAPTNGWDFWRAEFQFGRITNWRAIDYGRKNAKFVIRNKA